MYFELTVESCSTFSTCLSTSRSSLLRSVCISSSQWRHVRLSLHACRLQDPGCVGPCVHDLPSPNSQVAALCHSSHPHFLLLQRRHLDPLLENGRIPRLPLNGYILWQGMCWFSSLFSAARYLTVFLRLTHPFVYIVKMLGFVWASGYHVRASWLLCGRCRCQNGLRHYDLGHCIRKVQA